MRATRAARAFKQKNKATRNERRDVSGMQMRCNSTASINIVREMNRDVRIPRGNVFEGDGGRRVEGGEGGGLHSANDE